MGRRAVFGGLVLAVVSSAASAERPQPVVPRPVVAVAPDFPSVAHQARIDGTVRVLATVDERGTVQATSLIEGHRLLAEAALTAARLWTFEVTKGEAPQEIELTFVFTLVPENACVQKTLPRFTPPARVDVAARRVVPTCSDCLPGKPIAYEKCE